MAEVLLNWVADTLSRSDIIDLYFIISDLVDIPLSQSQIYETAHYDSLAMNTAIHASHAENIPIGKLVL